MSNWMKAVNPLSTPSSEPEALAAARASTIAIGIGLLYGVVGLTFGMDTMKAGMDAQAANNPAVTGETMFHIALGMAALMMLVQLVLAVFQWVKPNIVIPIIFAILVGYGLIMVPLGPMMSENMGLETPVMPVWQTVTGVVVMVVELALHIAGIRGATALKRFRDAQAY